MRDGIEPLDGVLVVDKPIGPTSHDVVARLRRVLRERRIGHTGTLDPLASGVLPLVVGRATRLARFLSADDKSYDAFVRLGISTDTDDALGRPVGEEPPGRLPSLETIEAALGTFRGSFLQRPPAYSAKHIEGKRSYAIARARNRAGVAPGSDGSGAVMEGPPAVTVTVHRLEMTGLDGTTVGLRIECSSGFYVRSLARDLGRNLGIGAHLSGLRRTASGSFTLSQAMPLSNAEQHPESIASSFIPLARLLPHLHRAELTDEGARRARHGQELQPSLWSSRLDAPVGAWVRLLGPEGDLIGLARAVGPFGALHPAVVLK